MKPAQWAVAAILLAAMVFAVTFAMNFLGSPPVGPSRLPTGDPTADLTLTFYGVDSAPWDHALAKLEKAAPLGLPSQILPVEDEVGTSSRYDFWFANDNELPVVLGLRKLGCRCSAVEAFVIPPERSPRQLALSSAAAAGAGGPLAAVGGWFGTLYGFSMDADLSPAELLHANDSIKVPAHAVGWLRLRWKGDRVGPQNLGAAIWMNDKEVGVVKQLDVSVVHHPPVRTYGPLSLGVLTDEQLRQGVTRYLYVWSSTQPSFTLQAKPSAVRGGKAEHDPFSVGEPVPLTAAERQELYRDNNQGMMSQRDASMHGRVLAGYKVPVICRAMSSDGKVPFDIGPFRRGVTLTSDATEQPAVVPVSGRVRGLVELGIDDEGGSLDFGPFPRRLGARAALQLQSSVKGVKLTFDRQRTPKFLTATISEPTAVGESRQAWTLRARVEPGAVTGSFPRPEDPLYEDSAIYLIASAEGETPRPIRIAVRGTANES